MLDRDGSSSRFSATFPRRFAAAMADARGALAGIAASGGRDLVDASVLARAHEIYRLRIELEIETAAVLWRTAEVVSALAEATACLEGRGVKPSELRAHRARPVAGDGPVARRESWPEFGRPRAQMPPQRLGAARRVA